jgi:hypothetical protein
MNIPKERQMSAMQAILFGAMLSWTPSVVLLASEPAAATMVELSKPIMRQTKINVPACHTSEQFEKLASLTASGDIEARNHFLALRIKDGACRFIPKGTAVYIEESNFFGYPCVRVPGAIDCLYTSRALLDEVPIATSAPQSAAGDASPGHTKSDSLMGPP